MVYFVKSFDDFLRVKSGKIRVYGKKSANVLQTAEIYGKI
jgi:hypothetical protein